MPAPSSKQDPARPARPEGSRLIRVALVAFAITGVLVILVGGRLAPSGTPEPRFAVDEQARAGLDGSFQVTLDTSDPARFVAFDFAAGHAAAPSGTADLAARRYVLRAPHGALDLGVVALDRARVPADAAWAHDEKIGGEVQNPALKSWYRYSYFSHRLRPAGHTYAIRLAGRGVAFLEILGYYCPGEGPGCLTLRYRLDLETAPR